MLFGLIGNMERFGEDRVIMAMITESLGNKKEGPTAPLLFNIGHYRLAFVHSTVLPTNEKPKYPFTSSTSGDLSLISQEYVFPDLGS